MNNEIYDEIKRRWDGISKPIDGLGDFEDIVCKIGAVQETITPDITRKALIVMCADNGIVAEGVSQCGSEVTLQVAKALGRGSSTANTMALEAGIKVIPVDIGIDSDESLPGVLDHKIRRGSDNFLFKRALTEDEVQAAIDAGKALVDELAQKGYNLIVTGEMGIGNTTTATALLCLMTGIGPAIVTGRGAGLDDEAAGGVSLAAAEHRDHGSDAGQADPGLSPGIGAGGAQRAGGQAGEPGDSPGHLHGGGLHGAHFPSAAAGRVPVFGAL